MLTAYQKGFQRGYENALADGNIRPKMLLHRGSGSHLARTWHGKHHGLGQLVHGRVERGDK